MKSNVNMPEKAQQAERSARSAATSKWMTVLARLGYAVKGVVYLVIGILAVQLAAGKGGKAIDQRGAIHTIYDQPFGRFLLVVVAIGLIGFGFGLEVRPAPAKVDTATSIPTVPRNHTIVVQ